MNTENCLKIENKIKKILKKQKVVKLNKIKIKKFSSMNCPPSLENFFKQFFVF